MKELAGKVALITGGASGIGFAMAEAFAREDMKVVIADVDENALGQAEAQLAGLNTEVLALVLDVTDRQQFEAVAQAVEERFGGVDVLCNNAGVYRGASMDEVSYEDWDWVMGVNVGGVINGVQTFVQRMRERGEEAHIVNTASMAGVTTSPGLGVYNASKFAVVGMSESMRLDLEPHQIGVSVLCPGMVRTRILESERTRPESFEVDSESSNEAAATHNSMMQMAMSTAIEPSEVAAMVVEAVRNNDPYIFPHPEFKDAVQARFDSVLASFGEPDPKRLEAQAALADLLPENR